MTFMIPREQRVLTEAEYEALGYVKIGDLSAIRLRTEKDKPLSQGFTFPAYRADTQEEALIDIGVGLVKIGYTISTGGAIPAAKTALGYTLSLLG